MSVGSEPEESFAMVLPIRKFVPPTARDGAATLDVARTVSILTLDPAARTRGADDRWRALRDGWLEAIRPHLDERALAWACRYMLEDLGGRYPQAKLKAVRRRLKTRYKSATGLGLRYATPVVMPRPTNS